MNEWNNSSSSNSNDSITKGTASIVNLYVLFMPIFRFVFVWTRTRNINEYSLATCLAIASVLRFLFRSCSVFSHNRLHERAREPEKHKRKQNQSHSIWNGKQNEKRILPVWHLAHLNVTQNANKGREETNTKNLWDKFSIVSIAWHSFVCTQHTLTHTPTHAGQTTTEHRYTEWFMWWAMVISIEKKNSIRKLHFRVIRISFFCLCAEWDDWKRQPKFNGALIVQHSFQRNLKSHLDECSI